MPETLLPLPLHHRSRTHVYFQLHLEEGFINDGISTASDLAGVLDDALDCILPREHVELCESVLTIVDNAYFYTTVLVEETRNRRFATRGWIKNHPIRAICDEILRFAPDLKRDRRERLRFDPLTRTFKSAKI
jgi:hypothetical protein